MNACGALVYVVWGCVSIGLGMLYTKARVGGTFYSHKILAVGVGVSLSTHRDSGSMATQCMLST